jgi:ribosomal protein L37AE/L43A
MEKLILHEADKKCNCLFCLTKCPKCGASFKDFSFSVSFDMGKSENQIYMRGAIDSISERQDHSSELVCRKCGAEVAEVAEVSEKHFIKLQKALFRAVEGNIQIHRHEDGEIDVERFLVKTMPNLKEVKREGGS